MLKQFYFKEFSLAQVRSLNVQTVLLHSFNVSKQFYFRQISLE